MREKREGEEGGREGERVCEERSGEGGRGRREGEEGGRGRKEGGIGRREGGRRA